MRTAIFYFSQTGNTRKVAEAMQEALASTAGLCALYQLEQTDPAEVARYDFIGLGCPAFYFREPINVQQFIQSIPRHPDQDPPKPCFVFVTHGGTPGVVLSRLKDLLKSKNLLTVGAFQCLGVDTFPPFADRKPLIASGHPDESDLAAARRFALAMLELVKDPLWQKRSPSVTGDLVGHLAVSFFTDRGLRLLDRFGILPQKRILSQRCNRCGLCVQACPQGIISLKEDLPAISAEGCIYCYHCHRTCPQGAIACNWAILRLLSGHYLRKIFSSIFRKRK